MPSPTPIPANSLTANQAASMAFWRELCPSLPIEGNGGIPRAHLGMLDQLSRTLNEEGYVNEPGVLPQPLITRLAEGVRCLHERGIPPAFAFVYDDFWQVFRSLAPFLSATLGQDYRMLPDLWAWYVPPANEAAGWKPHRDRSVATVTADSRPTALTVWLPLTDATPLNGCMYVLPAHLDPGLQASIVPETGEYNFAGDVLQNIRALPAPAGSLLAWNQSLLHWGARASRLGSHPRCSIALQFQRGDLPPFEAPLLDPHTLPTFHERIGLIGHLIRVFSGFLVLTPEMRCLGAALDWKFWGRAAR